MPVASFGRGGSNGATRSHRSSGTRSARTRTPCRPRSSSTRPAASQRDLHAGSGVSSPDRALSPSALQRKVVSEVLRLQPLLLHEERTGQARCPDLLRAQKNPETSQGKRVIRRVEQTAPMLRSVVKRELPALLRIASPQWEARQEDLRTGDRIQRNTGELARVVERFHPIREVLLRIRTANPFLRSRDQKRLGDLGRRHPELQRTHTGPRPQLPALLLRITPIHPLLRSDRSGPSRTHKAIGQGANSAVQVPTGLLLSAGIILKRSVSRWHGASTGRPHRAGSQRSRGSLL